MTTEINLPRHVALYRDICRHTECDTRRLAYADVLDEIGDHDRAEFIRVQVELAMPSCQDVAGCFAGPPRNKALADRARHCRCDDCVLRGRLKGRADELLAAHPEWRKCPCPACEGTNRTFDACPCGGSGDLFHPFGDGAKPRTVHFARGFPDSVECTAADVWREEDVPCPHCEDAPTCPETNVVECSRCDCTGVIDTRTVPTEWAKAVVRVSPVTRFVVTDFVPAGSARHGGWWRWYAGEARDEVPQVVFDLLVGEYPSDWRGAALVPYWRSEAAARDALAVALAKWVRAAAYPVAPGG